MTGNKPTHRLVMRDSYVQNGETKIKWTNVLSLRENDKGQLIINLPKGMLLSGTLYIFKNDEDNSSQEQEMDDDLPF